MVYIHAGPYISQKCRSLGIVLLAPPVIPLTVESGGKSAFSSACSKQLINRQLLITSPDYIASLVIANHVLGESDQYKH